MGHGGLWVIPKIRITTFECVDNTDIMRVIQ